MLLDEAALKEALKEFTGDVEQIPPMYSALKHQGVRLYELARQGKVVEREPRTVHISEIKLGAVTADSFELTVACSKGTYIRTLVEDIAKAIGGCAHVAELRRTGVGKLNEGDMITLSTLEEAGEGEALDAYLQPIDQALGAWPEIALTADSAYYLQNGQPVQVPAAPTTGLLRLYDDQQQFLGVGEILSDGRVAPRRLFVKNRA
ncbi:MAG: tRNA pseudouridine(55) synthase TruB, partial [Gammaproteobacteria bacterium]|nr:tRNA pseudouridine(55) synthase TruB [Gammaproteobacteria bacterium]